MASWLDSATVCGRIICASELSCGIILRDIPKYDSGPVEAIERTLYSYAWSTDKRRSA